MTAIVNRFAFRAADQDLDALEAIVAGLRAEGHWRSNRTDAVRWALVHAAPNSRLSRRPPPPPIPLPKPPPHRSRQPQTRRGPPNAASRHTSGPRYDRLHGYH